MLQNNMRLSHLMFYILIYMRNVEMEKVHLRDAVRLTGFYPKLQLMIALLICATSKHLPIADVTAHHFVSQAHGYGIWQQLFTTLQ